MKAGTEAWGRKRLSQIVKLVARILGALVLLAMALFCAFGFFASFEPGYGWIWKVGYVALGCGFLAGAAVLVRLAFGGMSDTQPSGEGQSTL